MECSRCMELFSDYMDGALDERTRAGVEDHLESCSRCAGELRSLRTCVDALASMDEEKAPKDFLHRLHERIERDERSSWRQWLKHRLFFPPRLKVPLGAAGLALAALLLVVTYQETKLRNVPVQSPALAPAPVPLVQSPERAQPAAPPSGGLASSADRALTTREPVGAAPGSNRTRKIASPPAPVHIVLVLPSRERGQARLFHEKDERVESAGVVSEIRKVVERLGGRLDVVTGGNAAGENQALRAHVPGESLAVFLNALKEMGRIHEPREALPRYSDREDVLIHLSIEHEEEGK